MRRPTLIAFVCLLIIFQGCKGEDPALSPKIAQLIGTWQLVQPNSTYNVTLEFALDTANPPNDVTPIKASGKASVNTYNGFLSAALDGLMVITALGSTKVAGAPEAMQFEQTYFTNLKGVVKYSQTTANDLHLHYGGAQPGELVYKRIN